MWCSDIIIITLILETASSACIMRVALVGCPSHTYDKGKRRIKLKRKNTTGRPLF